MEGGSWMVVCKESAVKRFGSKFFVKGAPSPATLMNQITGRATKMTPQLPPLTLSVPTVQLDRWLPEMAAQHP
jgi:hypothetical protein